MINKPKEENKNNTNILPLLTEPNSLSSKKALYYSQKVGSKSAIKNKLNSGDTLSSRNKEKLIKTGNNIFLLKTQTNFKRFNKKSKIIKLKNNMLFNKGIPGCSPYDPYLIKVCKNAIVNLKKQLPNYKDVIRKINTEFGIEDDHIKCSSYIKNNKFIKTFDTLSEFKTHYTKETNNLEQNEKNINSKSKDINETENNKK